MARNQFNSIPIRTPKRYRHKLSYTHKYTCEMGTLIPCYVQDVLPNDRFRVNVANLIRFAPMVAPLMAEIDVYFHFFFVPNRLLWDNWETFITGADKGNILPENELPQKFRVVFSGQYLNAATADSASGVDAVAPLRDKSLADYLGFQTWDKAQSFSNGTYALDAMPFIAYQKIWEDYYRDENLEEPVTDLFTDQNGDVQWQTNPDILGNLFFLRRRSWRKDYFTSALPWAQKGDDVLIPGGSSDLSFRSGNVSLNGGSLFYGQNIGPINNGAVTANVSGGSNGSVSFSALQDSSTGQYGTISQNASRLHFDASSLNDFINSSSVGEGTIRELRRAYAAQAFLERRAVGGSRYVEQNLAFFGARSSDGRLQRAQFLGGYKTPVVISQVLQTSESTSNSPQGQPSGNAVNAGSGFIFDKTFEEYGFIIGIMSVMPRADYMRGIPKMYLKQDVFDYYWPQFARIGEQPIQNQELFFDPTKSTNEDTFGYTPRYAEYRFRNNQVSGDFKSSLSFWTMARDFDSAPPLNSDFIHCKPRMDVFAVEKTSFQHLWVETAFDVRALRPIPLYGESY